MKHRFALLLIVHILTIVPQVMAQDDEYVVTSTTLNMREGPGPEYSVIISLPKGESVDVIDRYDNGWWRVRHGYETGYVASRYLVSATVHYKGWERTSISSGDEPDCWNYSPTFDTQMDNYLKVNVGSNTDVVIKLMDMSTEQCIRYVYIRSDEVYYLRNIPQGTYYLKFAYGRDWRQKVESGQCVGKFMRNALYKKGMEIMDYHLQPMYGGYNVPSFELSLDVVGYNVRNTFDSSNISEREFNQ